MTYESSSQNDVTGIANLCPVCRTPLSRDASNGLALWTCEQQHGVAIGLIEAWQGLQGDEIRAIWDGVATAPEAPQRLCLNNDKPMKQVLATVDDDKVLGNEGLGAREQTAYVDQDGQMVWFDSNDFATMPQNESNGGLTVAQQQQVQQLIEQFGSQLAKANANN